MTADTWGRPAPPIRMPAQPPLPGNWTFHVDQLVGGVPLGPVQPTGFSCTWRHSGFGNGEITLPVSNGVIPEDRITRLWSWRVWALWQGTPVWCGVPTGVQDEGSESVTVTLTELTGYLEKRQLEQAWNVTQMEQTQIAAVLAQPVEDVGVSIVTDPGGGYLRDRTFEALEGQNRGELLTNLSQVIDGPQFRSEYGMTSAGLPYCRLMIGYPEVGSDTGLGITVPGHVTAYSAQWDADAMRTRTFAVGDLPDDAAEDAQKPVVTEDRPQPDLPRLDAVDDWPGTVLVSTLTERAQQQATANALPALQLTGTTRETFPPLSTYDVGDIVTINVTSPLMPGGLTDKGRLTEMTASAGSSSVAWTVQTSVPPPTVRPTLTRRLSRIEYLQAAVLRRGNNLGSTP